MQGAGSSQRTVRFGDYEVDLPAGRLRKRGVKVRLPGQSFEVLATLLEHPGEVVTREELRRRLWPEDVFVDFENSLNTAISRLREALSDSAEHPRFIETLPKRGYRFIASLSEPTPATGRPVTPKARLMVLPFVNLSGDPAQDYFSDGMTEEMITEFARLAPAHLRVIARTTAMRYKGSDKDVARIGRELGVDYVLEGSVRRSDDRVRISAQLIEVREQTHVWAETYDAELRDVLSIQQDVAQAIAAQAGIAPPMQTGPQVGRVHPVNPQAHDAYLSGLYHYSRFEPDGLGKAAECFGRAIEQDPAHASAHARLSITCIAAGFFGYVPQAVVFPKAEAAALKSLELDDTLAEAHAALGMVRWLHTWDLAGGRRELERAVEVNRNDPLAHNLLAMFLGAMEEDHQEAARAIGLAQELDPLSMAVWVSAGWLFYFSRQHDRAIAHARQMLEMDEKCLPAWCVLGLAAWAKGSFHEAIGAFEQATKRSADPLSLAWLGTACGLAGERERARAVLGGLEEMAASRHVPAICRAWIHMGLGDKDTALDWLEKGYSEHDPQILWLRVTTGYDPLRGEPRFERLVARLNLPPRAR